MDNWNRVEDNKYRYNIDNQYTLSRSYECHDNGSDLSNCDFDCWAFGIDDMTMGFNFTIGKDDDATAKKWAENIINLLFVEVLN